MRVLRASFADERSRCANDLLPCASAHEGPSITSKEARFHVHPQRILHGQEHWRLSIDSPRNDTYDVIQTAGYSGRQSLSSPLGTRAVPSCVVFPTPAVSLTLPLALGVVVRPPVPRGGCPGSRESVRAAISRVSARRPRTRLRACSVAMVPPVMVFVVLFCSPLPLLLLLRPLFLLPLCLAPPPFLPLSVTLGIARSTWTCRICGCNCYRIGPSSRSCRCESAGFAARCKPSAERDKIY